MGGAPQPGPFASRGKEGMPVRMKQPLITEILGEQVDSQLTARPRQVEVDTLPNISRDKRGDIHHPVGGGKWE